MARGFKISRISNVSMIAAIALAIMAVGLAFVGHYEIKAISAATIDFIECNNAAQSFENSSETLTSNARLFASSANTEYLNDYFREYSTNKQREAAVESLKRLSEDNESRSLIDDAMAKSKELEKYEFYSMRLVCDSAGIPAESQPSLLRDVVISNDDSALSANEKRALAQSILYSEQYSTIKEAILQNVSKCSNYILASMTKTRSKASEVYFSVYVSLCIAIGIIAILLIAMSLVIRKQIVKPLIEFGRHMDADRDLPITGTCELRALATTYNNMHSVNKRTRITMRKEAELDALTGVMNRRSFDRAFTSFANSNRNFTFALIDVDLFKNINDTYGHSVGDIALKRVAEVLLDSFRNNDFICRYGGDEFCVLMVDSDSTLEKSVEEKLNSVRNRLAKSQGECPALTVSIGVAFRDLCESTEEVFERADEALYDVKASGRNGYRFWKP